MKIVIGCDPNAQSVKEEVIAYINKKGYGTVSYTHLSFYCCLLFQFDFTVVYCFCQEPGMRKSGNRTGSSVCMKP